MVSNSNVPRAKFNLLKWLVGTAVSLITVGSSLIAILDFIDRHEIPSPLPNPGAAVLTIPASSPTTVLPTQTSLSTATSTSLPVLPTETSTATVVSPTPQKPDPAAFVLSYWQNVSDHNFKAAWAQLSPEFQKTIHGDSYDDYAYGYQQMEVCRIDVNDLNVVQQNDFSAIVKAHVTYYTHAQCNPDGFNFEMWLVYDRSTNSWLFDKNFRR